MGSWTSYFVAGFARVWGIGDGRDWNKKRNWLELQLKQVDGMDMSKCNTYSSLIEQLYLQWGIGEEQDRLAVWE